jgi:hypothetical protein
MVLAEQVREETRQLLAQTEPPIRVMVVARVVLGQTQQAQAELAVLVSSSSRFISKQYPNDMKVRYLKKQGGVIEPHVEPKF